LRWFGFVGLSAVVCRCRIVVVVVGVVVFVVYRDLFCNEPFCDRRAILFTAISVLAGRSSVPFQVSSPAFALPEFRP
jgi:hypothetical protein